MSFEPMNQHTNLIFAHVPKCAGSSVVATLRESRGNTFAVKWGRIDETWNQFLGSNRTNHFVFGHLRNRHLEQLSPFITDYRLITFLRHPVDRLVSVYRYNASPASPNYQEFIRDNPDFEEWVLDYSERFPNDIASFIAGDVANAKEYVEILLNRFHFIGFQETYRSDMARLCKLIGIPQEVRRENVTELTKHNEIKVSTNLKVRIAKKNAMDVLAYKLIREKLKQ